MPTLREEVETLRRVPLFAAIDPAKLKLLAFASDRISYQDGQTVFEQGDPGDAAYVVLEGHADIIVGRGEDEMVVAGAGTNSVIGEIAILCDTPRTATVRARGSMVALKVRKEHFLDLIVEFPRLAIEVMRELALRLSRTTGELTEARRELDGRTRH